MSGPARVRAHRRESAMFRYLVSLTLGRAVLWCYFIWYLIALALYFEPAPTLWLTSLGVSVLIGLAFLFSTTPFPFGPVGLPFWAVLRFFLIPFCVSSYSALAQGKGFMLVLFPRWQETALASGLCALFVFAVLVAKRIQRG